LTFKILKNSLITVLYGNMVRSAADVSCRNKILSFKSDVQESLKLLDTKPSFVWKDIHQKCKSRKSDNYASNTTRPKADYTDQYVGRLPSSNTHSVNNLSVQNLFLPLHDAILIQVPAKVLAKDLQFEVLK
jgi:hypothetical protein